MALLFFDGFETAKDGVTYQGAEGLEGLVTATNAFGDAINGTVYPRTGNFMIKCNSASGVYIYKNLSSPIQTIIAGVAWNPFVNTISTNGLLSFYDSIAGSVQIVVRTAADGKIYVYRGNGAALLAESTTVCVQNTWYYIEVKVKIDNSAGEVYLYVNGVLEDSDTGIDTQNTANATVDRVTIGYDGGVSALDDSVFDDWYIADTTGSAPTNDVLLCPKVTPLFPDGAGNYTQWTPSTGSNYACVDEYPANNDTDYVSDDTAAQKDSYTFGNIATNVTIFGVECCIKARKDDATARTVRPITRISSTDYNGDTKTMGENYLHFYHLWAESPATASAWTPTELNGAEFGVEVVS